MRPTIADYRLIEPVPGAAAAGTESWRAEAPRRLADHGRVVVTEFVDVDGSAWEHLAGRLRRVASVRSPHLLPLLEAGRYDDEESGAPLSWAAAADAPPAPAGAERPTVLRLVAGAARGAHALHEAGLAHGAITPAAVTVAAATGSDATGALRPPLHDLVGEPGTTPGFARPEDLDTLDPIALWGEGPSRATDVWALAATTHVLVTGRPVHPALAGDDKVTAVQRVLLERPVVTVGTGDPLDDLLRSCFATDPAARPSSAAVLADELLRLAVRG